MPVARAPGHLCRGRDHAIFRPKAVHRRPLRRRKLDICHGSARPLRAYAPQPSCALRLALIRIRSAHLPLDS